MFRWFCHLNSFTMRVQACPDFERLLMVVLLVKRFGYVVEQFPLRLCGDTQPIVPVATEPLSAPTNFSIIISLAI